MQYETLIIFKCKYYYFTLLLFKNISYSFWWHWWNKGKNVFCAGVLKQNYLFNKCSFLLLFCNLNVQHTFYLLVPHKQFLIYIVFRKYSNLLKFQTDLILVSCTFMSKHKYDIGGKRYSYFWCQN